MVSKTKVKPKSEAKDSSKVKPSGKTYLLFDGDILCYRAAAVIEKRTVRITNKELELSKVFPTRTDFKDTLKLAGVTFDKEMFDFLDIQTPEPLQNATGIMDAQIKRIMDDLWADHYEVAISGKNNFRDNLPLPKKYKGNRDDNIRPIHLRDCKMHLYKKHCAYVSDNHEADDFLIFRGRELQKLGHKVVIVGVDKDSYAYGGLVMYDYTKDDPVEYEIPEFGELHIDKDKVKGSGELWFYFQLLNGDSADYYKPSDLVSEKFGEKSAYNLLKDCTNDQEACDVVTAKYKEWFGSSFTYTDWEGNEIVTDYKGLLALYFKCCRMMETKDDPLDWEVFMKNKGLKYAE